MMTVVEIPHIPITGLTKTDDPFSVLTLKADIGDKYTGEMIMQFLYMDIRISVCG